MQFTDAVTVAGTPPVASHHLVAAKRALAQFATEHGIPTPIHVEWSDRGEQVDFICPNDGNPFGIAAPKG